jgi:hypothetical protein
MCDVPTIAHGSRCKAATEAHAEVQAELETLALSYLRLAEQADRNGTADLVYETPVAAIPRPEQIPLPEDSSEA